VQMPHPCYREGPHIVADCLNLDQFVPSFPKPGKRLGKDS